MMTDSLYSPVRMFGGGRRESRNQVPIQIKVLAISKIQSGKAETVVQMIKLTVNGVGGKEWTRRLFGVI